MAMHRAPMQAVEVRRPAKTVLSDIITDDYPSDSGERYPTPSRSLPVGRSFDEEHVASVASKTTRWRRASSVTVDEAEYAGSVPGAVMPRVQQIAKSETPAAAAKSPPTPDSAARSRQRRGSSATKAGSTASGVGHMVCGPNGHMSVTPYDARPSLRVNHRRLGGLDVVFHVKRFLAELLLQSVLLPLSPLILGVMNGWGAVKNHLFCTPKNPLFVMQTLQVLLLILVNIAVFVLEDPYPLTFTQVMFTNVAFVAYRGVIAVKYAFMTTEDYRAWMGDELPPERVNNENLFAWQMPTIPQLKVEINRTMKRLGVCLYAVRFHVAEADAAVMQHFLGDISAYWSVDGCSGRSIPAVVVVAQLMRRASEVPIGTAMRVSVVLASIAQGGFPLFFAVLDPCLTEARPVDSWETWSLCACMCNALLQVAIANTFLNFMLSAVADYRRRNRVLSELGAMIATRPGGKLWMESRFQDADGMVWSQDSFESMTPMPHRGIKTHDSSGSVTEDESPSLLSPGVRPQTISEVVPERQGGGGGASGGSAGDGAGVDLEAGAEGAQKPTFSSDIGRQMAVEMMANRADDPLIDLANVDNANAFLITRRALLAVGTRYWKRIEMLTSFAFLMLLSGIVWAMVSLAVGRVVDATFAQGAMAICSVAVTLSKCVHNGARANGQHVLHLQLVDAARTDLVLAAAHARLAEGDVDASWAATAAERVLRAVGSELVHDDAIHPITVFGMRASYTLVRSLLVAFVSTASLLLRLFV